MDGSDIERVASQEFKEEPSEDDGEEADIENIENIALEEVIPAAVGGDHEAHRLLLFCNWLSKLLDKISLREERQFRGMVKAEEIRDFLFETACLKISTLFNPHKTSWEKALRAWLYQAARHRSLNIVRHLGYVGDYSASLARELMSPADRSQEEMFDRIFFRSDVRRAVWTVYHGLDAGDAVLVMLWAKARKHREMSAQIGMSVSKVHRRLKGPQKEFVSAVMRVIAEEVWKMKPAEGAEARMAEILEEHQDGIFEMIRNSLLEIEDHRGVWAGA